MKQMLAKIERRRRLVRMLRSCTPPTDEAWARRCPRGHCGWRRDGTDVCVLPVCMGKEWK